MPNVNLLVRDQSFDPTCFTVQKHLPVSIPTAVSLAGVQVWGFTPGYRFIVQSVRSFARTVTATISFNVRIGTQTCMASATNVPVADTDTNHALSATGTDLRGLDTERLNITLTTDGTGAATNLTVTITLRVLGMNDESDAA